MSETEKIVIVADNTIMGELGILCFPCGLFQKKVKITYTPVVPEPKVEPTSTPQ
jgi:hypothetical protein